MMPNPSFHRTCAESRAGPVNSNVRASIWINDFLSAARKGIASICGFGHCVHTSLHTVIPLSLYRLLLADDSGLRSNRVLLLDSTGTRKIWKILLCGC